MVGIALAGGGRTGSVMNHIHSRAVIGQPTPEVGMGVTLLGWTDRHPGTIVRVAGNGLPGTLIDVQEDNYERIDTNGWSEDQEYTYTPNPNGVRHVFRMRKDGVWEGVRLNPETNRWKKTDGHGLRIGVREKYWDPSF